MPSVALLCSARQSLRFWGNSGRSAYRGPGGPRRFRRLSADAKAGWFAKRVWFPGRSDRIQIRRIANTHHPKKGIFVVGPRRGGLQTWTTAKMMFNTICRCRLAVGLTLITGDRKIGDAGLRRQAITRKMGFGMRGRYGRTGNKYQRHQKDS